MIGAFGKVVFSVSDSQIRTFSGMTRSNAGRWAEHEVLNRKPTLQYLGPGLDTMSFTMTFNISFGVDPRKEMDELVVMEREGKAHALTLGGKGFGRGLWVITSLEQSFDLIDNNGKILEGSSTVSLKEYVVRRR